MFYRKKKDEKGQFHQENRTGQNGQIQQNRQSRQSAEWAERQERLEWKVKKGLMGFSALFLVFGLCLVDIGYSEMMDEKGKLIPQIRRIDEETVAVYAFGKSLQINLEERKIKIENG